MNAQVHKFDLDPKLTKAQKDLLVALSGRSCAWRARNQWRPKGSLKGFQLAAGDALMRHGLAEQVYGKGTTRLELTGSGEAFARQVKYQRQQESRR